MRDRFVVHIAFIVACASEERLHASTRCSRHLGCHPCLLRNEEKSISLALQSVRSNSEVEIYTHTRVLRDGLARIYILLSRVSLQIELRRRCNTDETTERLPKRHSRSHSKSWVASEVLVTFNANLNGGHGLLPAFQYALAGITEGVAIEIDVTNFVDASEIYYMSHRIVSSCHENYVHAHYGTLH